MGFSGQFSALMKPPVVTPHLPTATSKGLAEQLFPGSVWSSPTLSATLPETGRMLNLLKHLGITSAPLSAIKAALPAAELC